MKLISPYKILGVSRKCTEKELKMAYLKMAKLHHPDANKNMGATEQFRKINEAYESIKKDRSQRSLNMNSSMMNDFGRQSVNGELKFNLCVIG
jgi:DnaJ-class molecular chaperone